MRIFFRMRNSLSTDNMMLSLRKVDFDEIVVIFGRFHVLEYFCLV